MTAARLSPTLRSAAELDSCICAPPAPRGEAAREKEWASFTRSHYPRSYAARSESARRGWHTAEIIGMECGAAAHTRADTAQTALPTGSVDTVAETIGHLQALRYYLSQRMHTGSNTTDHPHDNLHALGAAAARPATFDQQLFIVRYTHGASGRPSVPKLMSQF